MEELKNEDLVKSDDVAISTRIRIARNIKEYDFPLYISLEDSDRLTNDVLNVIRDNFPDEDYRFYRIGDLDNKKRLMYVEKHLISRDLIEKNSKSSFLTRNDEKVSIMINEEDHIRIQVLLDGLNLYEAWKYCSEIDDRLQAKLNFAYHEDFGYLTACPTNVGTGLRASVMVHLPCIAMTGQINSFKEALRKLGLTVRGLYGEGTEAIGDMYQISNQITLGDSEEEIIGKLNKIINQIVKRERNTREYLKSHKSIEIENKLYRSFGILKYSRLLSTKEAMKHLSNVKLAYDMELIKHDKLKDIMNLMDDIKPSIIQTNLDNDIDKEERDKIRANIIRDYFSEMEG